MKKIASKIAKGLVPIFIVIVIFCAMPLSVAAKPMNIHDIDILAQLNNDGSARITETWDVSISEGTEFFIAKENLQSAQSIKDLSVTDATGRTYAILDDWDVDELRSQKDGKAGLLHTGGGNVEICIGFGEYGRHQLTLSYTLTNLVIGYNDADALNQSFLPMKLSSQPPHVKLTVSYANTPMNKDNTLLWVFRFPSNYGLQNGEAVFESDRTLKTGEGLIALMRFEKGMFSPQESILKDFDDVLAEAKQGSEYEIEDEGGSFIEATTIMIGMAVIAIPLVILSTVVGSRNKKGRGVRGFVPIPKERDLAYYRELPFGGNLEAANAGLTWAGQIAEDEESGIIGALILRWIQAGFVVPTVAMGGTIWKKEETALWLGVPKNPLPPLEQKLYSMMVSAGGQDSVLQSKEFEKWSKSNYMSISTWMDEYYTQGMITLRGMGVVQQENHKTLGMFSYQKDVITPWGIQRIVEAMGFKKYLSDFTIINERQAQEVHLWEDYLVFAHLFGIADAVMQQFQQLYPAYFAPPTADGQMGGSMYHIWMAASISRSFSRSAHRGYSAAQAAASGGGGHSSGGFGGGGGSFGGGGSAGSR